MLNRTFMLKQIAALALALPAFIASAAEVVDSRHLTPALATGGEVVKTAVVQTAVARQEAAPARKTQAAEDRSHEVSWPMVLAAVALMATVALRRQFGPQ